MKTAFAAITESLFPDLAPVADSTQPPPVRQQARAAEWRAHLARAYAYQVQQARSPEEAEAIEREYERQFAEGPDFTRYRRKSEFRDAPKISGGREERHRLMMVFRTIARGTWAAKEKGKHRGVITRTCEDVFQALMWLAQRHGRVYPSYDGLARLARCCRRSVASAIEMLVELGFVTRHRRIKRVSTPLGLQVVQASNAYDIHPPRSAFGRMAVTMFVERRECKNSPPKSPDPLSFLARHPETWGGTALAGGSGVPPEAAPVF